MLRTNGRSSVEAPERRGEPRLVIAGLAPFYATTSSIWYPFLRFVAGGLLIIPGWQHFENGATLFVVTSLAKNGFPQSLAIAYFIIFIEMIGGACIAVGVLDAIVRSGMRNSNGVDCIWCTVATRVRYAHYFSAVGCGLL